MGAKELSCEEVIEALFDFLDNELCSARQEDIERHLRRCRDCFTRAEFERRLRDRINQTATVSAPESLRQRIHQMLDEF